MAQNPGNDAELRLGIFGGQVTNVDPTSLPSGVSPDCPNMSFLPGSTFSRPCFSKLFATPLGSVTVTYLKSYIDNQKIVRNLILDSAGNLWIQNVTTGALPTIITTTTPGSYAKSSTCFGREYIAFNNTLHGSDIPLQLSFDASGAAQLDRVTQDGPGAPPSVSNLIIPATAIAASGSPIVLTITEVDPENADPDSGFFTSINVYTATALTGLDVGQSVVISGTSTAFDGAWGPITAIFPGSPALIQVAAYIPAGTAFWTGSASMTIQQGALQRQSNVVTGNTTTAHQLQPGYQVQITNALAQTIGSGVSSIVINNGNLAGIATVTVGLAAGQTNHGLVPGLKVSITGVKPVTVGTSITSVTRVGQVVTVLMSASTGLAPGAIVTLSGVATTSFNTTARVATVSTTTNTGDTFTFPQVDIDATDSGGGTVKINWPIPDTPTPSLFEVVAAPTSTTFQVAVNYADGTWTTGAVTLAWNGTFFVQTVPDSITFTYLSNGPDGSASPVSGAISVTPYGQATPGEHQVQVFFIDRQGGTTRPSPPVKFVANGGQYIRLANIPIGPPNIVARAIAFTGAYGAYFFYIPAPPQINGQLVGTATQINDNTSTSAVFDFADPTLFAALGISIEGNNLANQVILDGSLGFGFYGSRLIAYGQRNTIQNLLNMGFDGGYLVVNSGAATLGQNYTIVSVGTTNWVSIGAASNTVGIIFTATGPAIGTGTAAWNFPLGWNGGGTGALVAGHYGTGWRTSATILSQSMYQEYTGAPIANANDRYRFRTWIGSAGTVQITIVSVSASFVSFVNLTSTGAGFYEGNFNLPMPSTIPSDITLGITGSGVVVDEMAIIFQETPYLNTLFGSYINNPTGFDGVSGVFGPVEDTHQPLDLFVNRGNLHILTQDPQGRLHQTFQGIGEPSTWVVDEIAANCGTVSAFACAVSQADDATETGGKQWASWYSFSGFLIYGGEQPDKISQELQRPPGVTFAGAPSDLSNINPEAYLTVWAMNDPQQQIIYLGIPLEDSTAPNTVYAMNYIGLDSAAAIATADPIRRTSNSRFVASEVARKWSPWSRPINRGALLYGADGTFRTVFAAGNGLTPNSSSVGAHGNIYELDPNLYTDDDYGLVVPYYVTYPFPDAESEQAFQLGSGMKTISYVQSFFSGVGNMVMSLYYGTLGFPWSLDSGNYLMTQAPQWNAEWGAGQCTGQRFFVKLASSPNAAGDTPSPTTDNAFSVSDLILAIRKNMRMLVRGKFP